MFKQKITILNSAIMLVILSMPVLSVKYDKLTPNAQYTRAVKFLEKESYKKAEKALKLTPNQHQRIQMAGICMLLLTENLGTMKKLKIIIRKH